MLRRAASFLLLAWLAGFLLFAIALPLPHEGGKSDAVVVFTGGEGRIPRGLDVLEKGWASKLLVSGVDREVRPAEFVAEYAVPARTMECCVSLGFESYDTRSNAAEAARWLAKGRFKSVRLVTTDWHMRRAAFELAKMIPDSVTVIRDAVPSEPSLRILFLEYHKLLASYVSRIWDQ
ncbi:MAG: YdcF family protein [Novosphingobium sp.]|nr:YdcF family protein [Novosphingobium sp.]